VLIASGHAVLPFYSQASSALAGLETSFRRLNGLTPPESPYHRRTGLGCVAGRCPPGFFPLQGIPSYAMPGSSPALLPRVFVPADSAESPQPSLLEPRLGVSVAQVVRSLSRGHDSLLRFLANTYSGFDAS